MKQVIDGYEITTASIEAAEQNKRGIESFIEWRMDPFDWLDRACLLYTSPSPRDRQKSRMPSSA